MAYDLNDARQRGQRPPAPADSWPKPFRLHLADGRVWHGAEFPGGRLAVSHPDEQTAFTVSLDMEALLVGPLADARVEWAAD